MWYPARDDVPFLRGPHAINSLRWEGDREDWLPLAVGEIFGTDRDYNPERGKPTAIGGHVCGSKEDFAGDGKIDLAPPFVEYRPDQLPMCCGAVFESGGGVALGGVATLVWYNRGSGGIALGGVADVIDSGRIVGRGGIALGGVATLELGAVARGGVALGGTATVQTPNDRIGLGGVALGGTATVTTTDNYTCPQAFPLELNEGFEGVAEAGGVHHWWRFASVPPGWYELELHAIPDFPGDGKLFIYEGDDCDHLTVIAFSGLANFEVIFFKFGPGPMWIEVYATATDHTKAFNGQVFHSP